MQGNNTLILNTATMIEAVQQWLDRQMVQRAPTVTGVEAEGKNYGSTTFKVELSTDAERPTSAGPAV